MTNWIQHCRVRKLDKLDKIRFRKLDKNPSENSKKSLDSLIANINAKIDKAKMNSIIGHNTPSHIYCNSKIHRTADNLSMRPTISQIGTVTYNSVNHPNSLLGPYHSEKHIIQTTSEFIEISKQVRSSKHLASLDVENLFTN